MTPGRTKRRSPGRSLAWPKAQVLETCIASSNPAALTISNDPHVKTASELFDIDVFDVTITQREFGKLWNHMSTYSAYPFPEVIKKGYCIPH